MDVRGGQDMPVMLVLNLHQLIREKTRPMIVNHRDGPDYFLALIRPFLLHQPLTDQVAEVFRAIRVPAGFHQSLELVK
jgi:hypothetical protein